MENITNIAIITGMTLGITEVIKRVGLRDKYAPLVALFIGVGVSFLFAPVGTEAIITGIVSALSAMGLYSGTSATLRANS